MPESTEVGGAQVNPFNSQTIKRENGRDALQVRKCFRADGSLGTMGRTVV